MYLFYRFPIYEFQFFICITQSIFYERSDKNEASLDSL